MPKVNCRKPFKLGQDTKDTEGTGTFNPPGASHHGGIWERMIRSVRQVLCSVLKEHALDEEGLQMVLCEAILNSCPLTTVT